MFNELRWEVCWYWWTWWPSLLKTSIFILYIMFSVNNMSVMVHQNCPIRALYTLDWVFWLANYRVRYKNPTQRFITVSPELNQLLRVKQDNSGLFQVWFRQVLLSIASHLYGCFHVLLHLNYKVGHICNVAITNLFCYVNIRYHALYLSIGSFRVDLKCKQSYDPCPATCFSTNTLKMRT